MGSLFDSIFGSSHRHDWVLIDKTEMKPADINITKMNGDAEALEIFRKMKQGYVVFVFKCADSSCGEIKTTEH